MTRNLIALPILIAMVFVSGSASSKRPTPPKSFVHHLRPTAEIESRSLPPIDLAARLAEEEQLRDEPAPFRVAYAIPLRASPQDAGSWETIPGVGSVWRLRVDSPGAVFLSFKFADFELPEGAELHFISVDPQLPRRRLHRETQPPTQALRLSDGSRRFGGHRAVPSRGFGTREPRTRIRFARIPKRHGDGRFRASRGRARCRE